MNEIRDRRRKRAIKVAITETFMVIALILLVIVSTMASIGYNFSFSKEVSIERTGLVAMRSFPTGANVDVDGEQVFGWTNLSRTMTEGEHTVRIYRNGFDEFNKTISVKQGMYYRMNYPRLFLKDIETEKVADFSNILNYSIAPNEDTMIAVDKKGAFSLYRINEEKPVSSVLDFSKILKDIELTENGIEFVSWSGNSERLITKINNEWYVLDLRKPEESTNIYSKFSINAEKMSFMNDAGDRIFVLEKGNLRVIELRDGKISEVIASNVMNYFNYRNDLVFVKNGEKDVEIGFYKDSSKEITVIKKFENIAENKNIFAMLGEYFGDKYFAFVANGNLEIYKGDEWDILNMESLYEGEIGEIKDVETRGDGGVLCFYNDNGVMIYDMEAENVVKNTTFGKSEWIDEFLLADFDNGGLFVVDFDGLNRRMIVADGAKDNGEVKISKNDRWMYYLGTDGYLKRAVIYK